MNILFEVLEHALPTWNAPDAFGAFGAFGGLGRSAESAEIHRLKLRKKAWRAKCVGQFPERREASCLMAFLGAPVENLIQRLQYLDARRNCVLDTMRSDSCPFTACRLQLATLSCEAATLVHCLCCS